MRLLVLSSVQPSYLHARAGYTVLACLLESLAGLGHEVAYATAGSANRTDEATASRLQNAGVVCTGDFTADLVDRRLGLAPWRRKIRTVRMAFMPHEGDDEPAFARPTESATSLLAWRPDAVLLFWDTWFEHLLPYLRDVRVLAYLAKPRHDSPMRALEERAAGNVESARDALSYRILRHQRARHFARLRQLSAASNICALDARQYREAGIPCTYVPNTWPDAFGVDWRRRRDVAQATRKGFGILGNIGDLGGSGEEIAGLLKQVAASPELAATLGANARLTYEREFAPSVVARDLAEMAGAA